MDYKNLFRKLERTLSTIERAEDLVVTLSAILQRLVEDFRDDLGLLGGRIYERRGGSYVLKSEVPSRRAPQGFRIPAAYHPIQEILRHGFVYRRLEDPGVDRDIEKAVGVEVFAAIGIGEGSKQIIAFTLAPGSAPDEVVHTLNTLRHAINLKLREEYYADRMLQAREIQMSLLPQRPPAHGDFDLWGVSVPAEEVGGDLFDFVPVSDRNLGIAVADASGHGLPAALQARDAIIGLRMGVEERLRITATIEKLNRVVNHSALSSKFISLFYGELETNGTLVYCNAGHPAPIVWDGQEFTELSRGGIVLGPDPSALYQRGFVRLEPKSAMVAYTDGVTEAEGRGGEAFGAHRIKAILQRKTWTSAKELAETVIADVRVHSRTEVPVDDQTVVAVVRRKKGKGSPA